jgi:uncharacterized protein YbdZ (MbtH family)
MNATDEGMDEFTVVINDEEQYSIWLAHRAVPDGWREVGYRGTKSQCLDHIAKVWVDMRPLSLRKRMEEWATNPPRETAPVFVDDAAPLVERLSGTQRRVEFRTRATDRVAYLKERIDLGYVHLVFPETRGGTELGMKLDKSACRFDGADFEKGTGEVELFGRLTLDDVPVECRAKVRLPELSGVGGLRQCSTNGGEAA